MNALTHITMNFTGVVRNEKLENRDYLAVPMIMMVEGVLNGSNGALFYPAEELAKVPQVWNMKPVVVYHPEMDGKALSACDPAVIESHKIGMIMNAEFDGKRLKAEAWLEPDRINIVDSRIAEAVANSMMMEVSTGLFTENEDVEGNFNGTPYNAIARNYRPDHLAILPDQIGACSIADGAGLLRNASNSTDMKKVLDALGFTANELSHSELRNELRALLPKATDDMGGPWIEDVYDDYLIYEKPDNEYHKQSYKIENDKAVLIGAAVPVERSIVYREPDGTLIGNQKGETEMKKDELVAKIIANTKFEEQDRELLEGMDETQLEKILPVENAEEKPAEETPAEEKPAEETPVENQKETAEEFVAKAPAEIREVLNDSLQTHAAKKMGLIESIVKNEKNIFTKEQLSSMSVNELTAISALAAVTETAPAQASYAGMAPVGNVAAGAEEEALVAPTMNFGKEE